MNAGKRLFIAIALIAVVGFVSFSQVRASVTYGPFNGSSPDSSTCGPNWGNDSYKYWMVYDSASGNGTIYFNGTGVTIAGVSPNACNSGVNNGGTVVAGIPYTFQGDMDFELKPGTVPSASCVPSAGSYSHWFKECSGDPAYQVATKYFIFAPYKVCDGRWWQNASANRGGNQGDITGGLPAQTGACAPSAEWFSPGDNRVDPQAGDRLAVWCNQSPVEHQIVVYGIANGGVGFFLTAFSNAEVLAAGPKGLYRDLGKNGLVSINGKLSWGVSYFWLAWNKGPYGGDGQNSWAKAFHCTFK